MTGQSLYPYDNLSDFLGKLDEMGELQRISVEVDPKHEMGAICRKLNIVKGPAVLFEKVKGSKIPVASQLLGSNRRLAIAIGCAEEDLIQEVLTRSGNLMAPNLVTKGPCQEVVKSGPDVDLGELPIVTNNPDDAAPYITAGHVILKDEELGRNVAIYRMMYCSKNELFIRFIPTQHGWFFLKKAEQRKLNALPVAVAIGVDPSIYIAGQFNPKVGVNELDIAGGLRRKPIDVVRCKTIDVEVPAYADIILECEMKLPPKTGTEGPFGEYMGYTTGIVKNERIMTVKAITHKKNPIYQNIWLGKPPHEHLYINALSYASQAYHELKPRFFGIKATYAPPGGMSKKLIIQIDEKLKYPGMVNDLLVSAVSTRTWKEVIVVDDDIDITRSEEVEWAMMTRVQPHRDIFTLSNCQGTRLDPSSDPDGVSGKLFIDATKKKDFKGPVAEPTKEMMQRVEARWKEYGLKF